MVAVCGIVGIFAVQCAMVPVMGYREFDTRSDENIRITYWMGTKMFQLLPIVGCIIFWKNTTTLKNCFGSHPVGYHPNVIIRPNSVSFGKHGHARVANS